MLLPLQEEEVVVVVVAAVAAGEGRMEEGSMGENTRVLRVMLIRHQLLALVQQEGEGGGVEAMVAV